MHRIGKTRGLWISQVTHKASSDEGYVIYSNVGRGGGLQRDPQSMQTTAKLSVPEVVALLISVSAMRAAGNFPFSELADAGLAKIDKVLPSDKVKDLRAFLDCLHIGQLSPLHDISDMGEMAPELLFALETAFIQRQLICFNDHDSRGQKTQRDIGNLLLMASKNSRRGTPESPIFHLPPHQERSALRHLWIWQK